jgi:hypothetical protein
MDGLLSYLMTHNGAIAVLSAYFVPYALPAWGVVFYRLVARKLTRAEGLVLGLFALGAVVELFQLMFEGGRYHPLGSLDFRSLHRYLGALAPLLWIWLAWLAASAWKMRNRGLRILLRCGVVVLFCWEGYSAVYQNLRDNAVALSARDALEAARQVAPVIRGDYAGPERQEKFKFCMNEYLTDRRPAVFDNLGVAAWAVNGQSEGPNRGNYPYPEDYLFVRAGQPYLCGLSQKEFRDPATDKRYEYVTSVRGTSSEWRLYRRKGTPHR